MAISQPITYVMSKLRQELDNIALAIREQDLTSEKIVASNFPQRVLDIVTVYEYGKYPIYVHGPANLWISAVPSGSTGYPEVIHLDRDGNGVIWVEDPGDYVITGTRYEDNLTTVTCTIHDLIVRLPELSWYRTFGFNGQGAATNGEYVLFGGGHYYKQTVGVVDAFDKDLVRTIPERFSVDRYRYGSSDVGNSIMFVGGGSGEDDTFCSSAVDIYDSALTRTTGTNINFPVYDVGGATNGIHGLFNGGWGYGNGSYYILQYTMVFTDAFVLTWWFQNDPADYLVSSTRFNNYAVFGGGTLTYSLGRSDHVYAYDQSLTKTTMESLSMGRQEVAVTTIGDHIIFGLGFDGVNACDHADAYTSTLTKCTISPLSFARACGSGTTVGNRALFAGGSTGGINGIDIVDVYNDSLVHSIERPLCEARSMMGAATINNIAMFGGGSGNMWCNGIDLYV